LNCELSTLNKNIKICSVKQIRDQNNETPANFGNHLNRWSLESIGVIALDTLLGVLDEGKETERSKLIIKVCGSLKKK
jgi:hypothetical protein